MSYEQGGLYVLEGCEGAGKTSAIEFLKENLPSDRFLFTREPGGSELGEALRGILKSGLGKNADAVTMLLLFFASRKDFMRNVVRPALARGLNVVTDRFDPSTLAYQVFGEQEPWATERLFAMLRSLICRPLPELYIYMDVTPDKGLERGRKAGTGDHFHDRGIEYHQRVREGFKFFLKNYAPANSVIVDANRDDPEIVAREVLNILRERALA